MTNNELTLEDLERAMKEVHERNSDHYFCTCKRGGLCLKHGTLTINKETYHKLKDNFENG